VTTVKEARDYLVSRGLTTEIAQAAKLRPGSGEFEGYVLFPWLNVDGTEIYVTGRNLNGDEPKYRHCKGPRPALHASPGAWKSSRVAVVEGQVDAVACAQSGTAAFACSGALTDGALEILGSKETVILALDDDDHGRRLAEKARDVLGGRLELLEVTWPDGCKDAGDVAQRAQESGADPTEAVAEVIFDATPVVVEPSLQTVSTKEIAEMPEPDRSDELMGGLLMRGQRVVIGAHTGHGKTTLTLQVARAFAHGEEFLDYKGAGGRALVIDAEQSLRTIKRRITEAGLTDSDNVHYLRVPDGLELDQDDDQAGALERVFATGGFDVVIADPLYKLHAGDSNDERSAVDLMKLFDGWREQYGFCLVLPVHCRKPPVGAKFSMHEFFGSTAYLRGAEVVLGLQMLRDGYSRLHFFKDRDGDLPLGEVWGLLFDRESGYRRDPEDGKPKETAADKVRELLEVDPGMTKARLIEATGYAARTVERALKDLGATEKSGPDNLKQWTLPLDDDAT
jgi:hypothetical protein